MTRRCHVASIAFMAIAPLFGAMMAPGCAERNAVVEPPSAGAGARMAAPSLSATAAPGPTASSSSPASSSASASASPSASASAPLPPNAIDARIARYPDEIRAGNSLDAKHKITLKRTRIGSFDIVFANVEVIGGNPNTYAKPALVIMATGEVETTADSVVGQADLDGDGRQDIVFKADVLTQWGGLTTMAVIADRAGGPVELVVAHRGGLQGAGGWSVIEIATHKGKPAIHGVTNGDADTLGNHQHEPTEDVMLQWNGTMLAVAASKKIGK